MKNFSWLMMMIAWLFTQNALAGNYYINSRYGADTNTGISMETPWKTMSNLETHLFLPGDSILFA